jgi:hypothetical protein
MIAVYIVVAIPILPAAAEVARRHDTLSPSLTPKVSHPANSDNPRGAGIHRWAVKDSTWDPMI